MRPGSRFDPVRHIFRGSGPPLVDFRLGPVFSLMTRHAHTDGDLLLGMLALECGLIDQEQLVAAFSAWNAGEGRSMAEILVEQGSLARADILRIANVLDENEPGLSATVAYLRSELLEEHHARTETATSSARGLLESMDSVERFRIVRPHARGGLGEVFLAVDAELDRQVALKELRPTMRRPAEPGALPERGPGDRAAGTSGNRAGLRPGPPCRRTAVLCDAVHRGGNTQTRD